MTRLYNDPTEFKGEMTDGFVAAYGRYVERVPDASGVMVAGGPIEGQVSVIIGGGSGHYPAFCGLVGQGLATAAVIGDIFTSPSGRQAYEVARAADGGAGILFSYGNYTGDVLNFGMAEQRLQNEGVDARTVIVTDDVASASADDRGERRGIAGDFYVFKAAGAAAERGDSLDDVEAYAKRANDMTRTFGVAFDGCTLPGKSEPLFTVEPDEMEIGLGIHGEPGIGTADMVSAGELATLLVERVLEDPPADAGNRVAVLLNGLGATKYEELFVVYRDVERQLRERGLQPHEPFVGEFVTSLDMAGCSLTLFWLDDELQSLHDAAASTPAFTRIGECPT